MADCLYLIELAKGGSTEKIEEAKEEDDAEEDGNTPQWKPVEWNRFSTQQQENTDNRAKWEQWQDDTQAQWFDSVNEWQRSFKSYKW